MEIHPNPELLHQVVLLSTQGMSRRAIARALQISRNTVRNLLKTHQERRMSTPNVPRAKKKRERPTKLDAYKGEVSRLMSTYPDITAQRVFEELRSQGFEGGYTQVKEYVRQNRPKPEPKVSRPVEPSAPGKMAHCDWSPYEIAFTVVGRRKVQCFSYALPYSHRKYYRFYSSADLYALLDGHVRAFAVFGGAAQICKYDSQKPVVLRWEANQPIYNPRFIDFCTWYEFQPLACRRGHPNDKPNVERGFWELEKSFFNGRSFRDEADLAAQLEGWRTGICDERPLRTEERERLDLFADEKPHLRPLPAHPYDTARVVYRVCDIEGFIAWEGNRYSLPYEHVTDLLPVRITQSELFVYAADLRLIARHELRPKGQAHKITLPGHHPPPYRHGPDLDQLRACYEEMDLRAARFFAGLSSAQSRSAAYHARQILALREHYATSDIVAALDHAERFAAFDHRAIERILRARAKPRALDEYVAESTARKLATVIAQSATEPRSLAEYDALPTWPPRSPGEDSPCPATAPESKSMPPQAEPQDPPPTSSSASASTSSDSDSSSSMTSSSRRI